MRLIQRSVIGFFSACLLLLSTFALAEDTAPVAVLKQSTQEMVVMLKKNRANLHNTKFLHAQVRAIVLPRFDVNTMARSVVGRNYWQSATPAQRDEFIRQFTNLVISVYAAPLADYNDDQVQFFPARGGSGAHAVVRTQIVRKNGQKISVVYQMVQAGGSWKAYDFSIEGISMVSSYRAQFASVLQAKGMNGLLAQLRQHHNRSA